MRTHSRHGSRAVSVFWPGRAGTVHSCTELPLSRPHACQLPPPTAYIKLPWFLATDRLPVWSVGNRRYVALEDRAGGEDAVPAASGSDSCIPEPAVLLLRPRRASLG